MIPLANGSYAHVDAEDREWLNEWHWRAYGGEYTGRYEKGGRIYMRRQIMPGPGVCARAGG